MNQVTPQIVFVSVSIYTLNDHVRFLRKPCGKGAFNDAVIHFPHRQRIGVFDWRVIEANHHMELRVNIVLQQAETCMFPPIHHLVKKLDVIFYRTKGECDFLAYTISNLAQHAGNVNAQYLQVGQLSFREAHSCFVDFVSSSKESLRVKRGIFFGQLSVKAQGHGDVLQERTFTDGQAERVVNLILRETGSSGGERDSAFPNCVDEMEMGLGKGS